MLFGILGSGQLAWMLSLRAKKSGFKTRVILTESDVEGCDALTFESEFLDYVLWKKTFSIVPVFPPLSAMELLSDKWEQKLLFEKYKIPTAKAKLLEAKEIPPTTGVAKWSRQGYDGYGNLVIQSLEDERFQDKWKTFSDLAKKQKSRIYLEELISFQAECALIVARDVNGKFLKYPTFITEQQNSVCNWVWGPAEKKFPQIEEKVKELWPKFQELLNSLSYVGVIAFEMFWVDGELLVNEVAPRVHNSGHITLEAFNWSQFDLHLKAFESFDGITLDAKSDFYMMKNILGRETFASNLEAVVWEEPDQSKIYWYGKKESRPGRKMGHINLCSDNRALLEKKEEELWLRVKNQKI